MLGGIVNTIVGRLHFFRAKSEWTAYRLILRMRFLEMPMLVNDRTITSQFDSRVCCLKRFFIAFL